MADAGNWPVATNALLLAAQLAEAVQEGLARRGFRDVRPAHAFAFAFWSLSPENGLVIRARPCQGGVLWSSAADARHRKPSTGSSVP
jgi:hypothetical protein